ncbi:hypothetical protein MMC14_009530 [Varicellaria rhodocarpa]|nr:hypothetical protein [Varicellaria rhodocarpa]
MSSPILARLGLTTAKAAAKAAKDAGEADKAAGEVSAAIGIATIGSFAMLLGYISYPYLRRTTYAPSPHYQPQTKSTQPNISIVYFQILPPNQGKKKPLPSLICKKNGENN